MKKIMVGYFVNPGNGMKMRVTAIYRGKYRVEFDCFKQTITKKQVFEIWNKQGKKV